jgi:hypothetical protein
MNVVAEASAGQPALHSEEWLRAARLTRLFSWLSLFWLGIEGTVAIVAGVMAGSVALIAFGLDSAIEGIASLVIIWRSSGSRLLSADAERRAQGSRRDSAFHSRPLHHLRGGRKSSSRARTLRRAFLGSDSPSQPSRSVSRWATPSGASARSSTQTPQSERERRTSSAATWPSRSLEAYSGMNPARALASDRRPAITSQATNAP